MRNAIPKRGVTDWDNYHRRVRVSQRFLWIIWRAYADLLRGISFDKPIKIIELGCGTGYHTGQMTKLFPVEKVTLVDFNANVIEDTKRRLSSLECEKEFLLQDLFSLELNEKYDIVHSQGLLEHYTSEKQQRLIRLHRDLLTPNGIAVILVPTPSLPYRLWRGLLERLHLWIYPDETAISQQQFTTALESNGLEVLKMKRCHLIELGAVCRRSGKEDRAVVKMPDDMMKGTAAEDRLGNRGVLSFARMPGRKTLLPRVSGYKMVHQFNSALCKVLIKYLKPSNGDRILDLGCGRGFYVREIEKYTDGVIGVDISESSLRAAVTPKVRYGDVTNLDFEAGSFDKVYSLHTIEHIPDLSCFLSEIARVIKPGGVAIIVYPWEPFRGFQAIVAAMRQYRNPFMVRKIHQHRLTPKKIQQLIEGTPLCHTQSIFTFAHGLQYLTVLTKKA